MKFRNIFKKDTWLAGLMLFSYLFSKKNNTKSIEIKEESTTDTTENNS